MSTRIHCPSCQTTYAFSPALVKRSYRCRQCRGTFTVADPFANASSATPSLHRPGTLAVRELPPPLPSTLVPPPLPSSKRQMTPASQRDDFGEPELPARKPRGDVRRPPGARAARSWNLALLVVLFALGFIGIAAGLGYWLWPTPDPSAPTESQPAIPLAPVTDVDRPKSLREILKDQPIEPNPRFGDVPAAPGMMPRPPERPERPPAAPAGPFVRPEFAALNPLAIGPAQLSADRVEISLDGDVSRIIPAARGRLLLLQLRDKRQLAVFDTVEAKIKKSIALASPDVMIAGGMNFFLIYAPGKNTLERWQCKSLEREALIPDAFSAEVRGLALGSASNGPLAVALHGPRQTAVGTSSLAYFEPRTLREIAYPVGGKPNIIGLGMRDSQVEVRMSADGSAMAAWGARASMLAQVDQIKGDGVTQNWKGGPVDPLLPSFDGRTFYSQNRLFDHNLIPAAPLGGGRQPTWRLPAVHGDFHLAIVQGDQEPAGDAGQPASIEVCRGRDGQALYTFAKLAEVRIGKQPAAAQALLFENSVVFVPEARLLAVVPSRDRAKLVLLRTARD